MPQATDHPNPLGQPPAPEPGSPGQARPCQPSHEQSRPEQSPLQLGQLGQRRSELGRELCRTMASIHRRGWCDGTGGNFSCVLQRQPLRLLMAPSGVDKGRVRSSELIVVDALGELIEGEGRTSAEMPLHRTIVEHTTAGAVLHTHSQAATLLSRCCIGCAAAASLKIEGLEMLKGLDGVTTHETEIAIPVLANDQNLARLSAAARPHLAEAPQGILIAGHGLYAWGDDLQQALRHLEILEFLLEQQWRQLLLNRLSVPAP